MGFFPLFLRSGYWNSLVLLSVHEIGINHTLMEFFSRESVELMEVGISMFFED